MSMGLGVLFLWVLLFPSTASSPLQAWQNDVISNSSSSLYNSSNQSQDTSYVTWFNTSNESWLSTNQSQEEMTLAALTSYPDGSDVMSKLLNSEKARTAFQGMPTKLQKALTKMDLSSLTDSEITKVPPEFWRRFNATDIETATRPQISALVKYFGEKGDTATLARISTAARGKLETLDYIKQIIQFAGNEPAKARGLLRPILSRLGDAEHWTHSEVNDWGRSILYIPTDQLSRMKDKEAMERVVEIYEETYFVTGKEMPSPDIGLQATVQQMLVQMYGNFSVWDASLIKKNARHLPYLTPFELESLIPREVYEAMPDLAKVEFRDRGHAQPILHKIFQAADFEKMRESKFVEFLKKLQKLEKYVTLIELVRPLKIFYQKPTGRRVLEYLKAHLDTTNDDMLGQLMLYNSSASDFMATANQIQAAGTLLQYAGPDFIKALADKNLLNKNSLDFIAGTPNLEKGLLFVLRQLIKRHYFKGGAARLTNTFPAAFVPIIGSDEISRIPTSHIQRHFSKFNQQIAALNMAQKAQLIAKIQQKALEVAFIDPGLAWMIAPYELLNMPQLKAEAMMSAFTPESSQVQLYIEEKSPSELKVKDLTDSPFLVGAMTTQMAQTFPQDDIMEVLIAINQSPYSPRPKVIKQLSSFVRDYLQTLDNVSTSDDISLVQALRDSEVELVGGQVLSHFRRSALRELPQDQCVGVYSVIGRLTPDRLNLIKPAKKRQEIASDALHCLKPDPEHQSLNVSNLSVLGYLLGYLPSHVIEEMDHNVFILSLPWLQGIGADSWSNPLRIQPCFSPEMREAIRNKLLAVFGSPANWTEPKLWTVGCLLNNLFKEDLDILNPELMFSMDKAMEQCPQNRQPITRIEEARLSLLQDQCNPAEEVKERQAISEGNRRLERMLAEAVTIASRKMEDVMGVDRRKRNGRAEINTLSCNTLRITRGALELIEDDLRNLTIPDLEACLERFGSHPLPKATAQALWKQIREAYNGADKISDDILMQLGHISVAMTTEDISYLDLKNLDVISTFGVIDGFDEEQLSALANATKRRLLPNVRNYSGVDLMSLGYILCGYTEEDVNKIPDEAYKNASAVLSFLQPCSTPVLKGLAKKAIKEFGEACGWTIGTLASIGAVVGGLAPEQIIAIPNVTFEGLTRAGARSLTPDSLKTLSTGQLQAFSVEGALSLTQEQKSHFVPEQIEALASVYMSPEEGKSSKGSAITGVIIAASISVLLQYFCIGPT